MARFRFTLQALLDLRERVEDDRRREVADLERVRLELQRALETAQANESDERRQWRAMLGAGEGGRAASRVIDLAGAKRQAFAIAGLVQQAGAIELRLAKARRAVEAARERLAHAAKERRAMELLRDQRRAEWERAQARAEAAMLDDLSMTKDVREAMHDASGVGGLEHDGEIGEEAA